MYPRERGKGYVLQLMVNSPAESVPGRGFFVKGGGDDDRDFKIGGLQAENGKFRKREALVGF